MPRNAAAHYLYPFDGPTNNKTSASMIRLPPKITPSMDASTNSQRVPEFKWVSADASRMQLHTTSTPSMDPSTRIRESTRLLDGSAQQLSANCRIEDNVRVVASSGMGKA